MLIKELKRNGSQQWETVLPRAFGINFYNIWSIDVFIKRAYEVVGTDTMQGGTLIKQDFTSIRFTLTCKIFDDI